MPRRLKDVGKTTADLEAAGFTSVHAKPFMHSHVSSACGGPVAALAAFTNFTLRYTATTHKFCYCACETWQVDSVVHISGAVTAALRTAFLHVALTLCFTALSVHLQLIT